MLGNGPVHEYRGYKIWLNTSGKSYYVAGPKARVNMWFKSIQTACNHIDFLIKYVI